ncbi:hypothetical protein DFH07DRAFT_782398 [Mycena maculata]|uniref:Uncharacterized protein n=1 Tax=Mycena maculata TaxID=230809 RepID=A0AAD7HSZ8_9AGAR|nr:hypothetical protein DFH07DRAFT_782398 [Mycena maculata]
MPRGRPRLDIDVKHQHVQQSRKRYEEQKRAQIAVADFHTRLKYRERSAMHSEKYRDGKAAEERKERRVRNVMNKQARKTEEQKLRKDHKAVAKPQHCPVPITMRGVPLKAAKCCATSPTTPTPAPRHIPAVVAADKDDPSEDESDKECTPCRLESPAWPIRASRPIRCQWCHDEDCCGCACIMKAATFSPTCEKCGGEDCPGYSWRAPKSRAKIDDHKDFDGMSLGRETYLKMKDNYPGASTFYAPTWFLFHKRWVLECTEYHNHEIQVSRASSPTPAPLSEPTDRSFQTLPKPKVCVRISSLRAVLGPEAIMHDDPRQAIHGAPMLYAVGGHSRVFQKRDEAILCLKATPGAELAFSRDASELFQFLAAAEKVQCHKSVPVKSTNTLYGVSGHKRVFVDRNRAVAILRRMTGAELVFSSDEHEFWGLLAVANRST